MSTLRPRALDYSVQRTHQRAELPLGDFGSARDGFRSVDLSRWVLRIVHADVATEPDRDGTIILQIELCALKSLGQRFEDGWRLQAWGGRIVSCPSGFVRIVRGHARTHPRHRTAKEAVRAMRAVPRILAPRRHAVGALPH